MTASTTLPSTAPAAPTPRRLGLRTVLFIAALLEAYDALSNVFILFGDMSEIPGPGFGGFLIKAHLAAVQGTAQIIAFPLMAACAIAYAARDRRLGIATALARLPTFSSGSA